MVRALYCSLLHKPIEARDLSCMISNYCELPRHVFFADCVLRLFSFCPLLLRGCVCGFRQVEQVTPASSRNLHIVPLPPQNLSHVHVPDIMRLLVPTTHPDLCTTASQVKSGLRWQTLAGPGVA